MPSRRAPKVTTSGAIPGRSSSEELVITFEVAFLDDDGAPLDGRNRYVTRLAPQPVAGTTWSLTMCSAETQQFVANAIDRHSVGNRTPGTVVEKDGSMKVFVQAEEPIDPRERANWLPAPRGRYYLLICHELPRATTLAVDWLPPPITKR